MLGLVGDDGDGAEGLAADLDGGFRIRQQVVVPGRMPVEPALPAVTM